MSLPYSFSLIDSYTLIKEYGKLLQPIHGDYTYSETELSWISMLVFCISTVYDSTGLMFPDSQQIKAAFSQLRHSRLLMMGGAGARERKMHQLFFPTSVHITV